MTTKRSLVSILVRSFSFLLVGGILYAQWDERVGRFIFFEQLDPPAVDPHRTQHLRDIYFLVYGTLGVILGFVASICADFRHALVTVLLSIFAFLTVVYRGSPDLLNPNSEEGYFGAPAIFITAASIVGVMCVLRLHRRDNPDVINVA